MKTLRFLPHLLSGWIILGQVSAATTRTWVGSGSKESLFTAADWSPSNNPQDGDTLVFPSTASDKTPSSTGFGDINVAEMLFTAGAYSIGGTGPIDSRIWNLTETTNGVVVGCLVKTFYGDMLIEVPNASVSLSFNGQVQFVNDHTITVEGAGRVSLNKLTGAGTIMKTGTGTLVIVGLNTLTNDGAFLSTLNLNGGILEVDQSGVDFNYTTNVASGTVLIGKGTSGAIVNRGTIAPGYMDLPTSTGTLTLNGNLTCPTDASSTIQIRLGGTSPGSYDSITRFGTADLRGATLSMTVNSGFVPQVGSSFTIISGGSSAALPPEPFQGLAEGAMFLSSGYAFSITYAGGPFANSVVVTRIALPNATLAITSAPGSSPLSVQIKGIPQEQLTVQKSTDLSNWVTLQPVVLDSTGQATVTDPVGTNTKAFYRAVGTDPQ